jgi:uncharacterized membrane protein
MSFLSDAKKILRTRFISGLLVVVPLILTFILLQALVESIDGLLRPLVIKLLGHSYDFPFIGVIATIVLIILSGIFTANVIGGRLLRLWERLILKIPLVRFVYSSVKQLVQALTMPQNKSFKSVVMVEYPRKGVYVLGFLANQAEFVASDKQQRLLSVFIPSTPTPISGFVALFPESDITYLNMTIEEGIKFFVSGSIISPEKIYFRQAFNKIETRNQQTNNIVKAGNSNEIKQNI